MKERPILFSGPMVRAILEGHKTQTRRTVKGAPPEQETLKGAVHLKSNKWGWLYDSGDRSSKFFPNGVIETGLKCPYGVVGDQLWVRESVCIAPKNWRAPDSSCRPDKDGDLRYVSYRADGEDEEGERCRESYGLKWTPSIHMPRWASRLTLEITDIRVERLQNISEPDAYLEGCDWRFCETCNESGEWAEGEICEDCAGVGGYKSSDEFRALWQSINGEQSWWDNPWVWVLKFKKVPQP